MSEKVKCIVSWYIVMSSDPPDLSVQSSAPYTRSIKILQSLESRIVIFTQTGHGCHFHNTSTFITKHWFLPFCTTLGGNPVLDVTVTPLEVFSSVLLLVTTQNVGCPLSFIPRDIGDQDTERENLPNEDTASTKNLIGILNSSPLCPKTKENVLPLVIQYINTS